MPTAAIDSDAIAVLPKCMNDLLNSGVSTTNIKVYDLHKCMDINELLTYDVIYVCGGSPTHLLSRMTEVGFHDILIQFIESGGVYIGVSAGSIITTKNLPNSLELINATIDVHQPAGSTTGIIDTTICPHIKLTDNQAILILDNECKIIE